MLSLTVRGADIMTREFKFRAWHHGGGDPRVTPDMNYSHPFPILFWKAVEEEVLAVELMQYTGLKDKNGVEIYEGDIIEYDFSNVTDVVKYSLTEIEDREGSKFPGFTLYSDCSFHCRVIGNIYENPELLDGE